jgi:hypothetical protein
MLGSVVISYDVLLTPSLFWEMGLGHVPSSKKREKLIHPFLGIANRYIY